VFLEVREKKKKNSFKKDEVVRRNLSDRGERGRKKLLLCCFTISMEGCNLVLGKGELADCLEAWRWGVVVGGGGVGGVGGGCGGGWGVGGGGGFLWGWGGVGGVVCGGGVGGWVGVWGVFAVGGFGWFEELLCLETDSEVLGNRGSFYQPKKALKKGDSILQVRKRSLTWPAGGKIQT